MRSRGQLDPASRDRGGVVARDLAPVAAGEQPLELWWRGAPGGPAFPGRHGEACVELGDELRQVRLDLRGAGQAQQADFGAEPVLQRLPQPFDAPLGLRAVGGDEGAAQFLEQLPELRGRLAAGELFLEGPVVVVADQGPEAVAVDASGLPCGPRTIPSMVR